MENSENINIKEYEEELEKLENEYLSFHPEMREELEDEEKTAETLKNYYKLN